MICDVQELQERLVLIVPSFAKHDQVDNIVHRTSEDFLRIECVTWKEKQIFHHQHLGEVTGPICMPVEWEGYYSIF